MKEPFQDVLDFHRKFDCFIGDLPSVPSRVTTDLRVALITEEYQELLDALYSGDMAGIADGGLDLIYVVLGTLVSYGVDPAPLWAAIQAANIAKAGGPVREDGKRLKPEGWQPPDIAGLLAAQRPLSEIYPGPDPT